MNPSRGELMNRVVWDIRVENGAYAAYRQHELCRRAVQLREKRERLRKSIAMGRRRGKEVIVKAISSYKTSVGGNPRWFGPSLRRWIARIIPQGWMP